jgi:Mrp family chromosome partitioning ATPase
MFDMPPVLAYHDVLAFSRCFDAALLVVGERETHKVGLKRSVELREKTELLGTVLNKSTDRNAGYGYY